MEYSAKRDAVIKINLRASSGYEVIVDARIDVDQWFLINTIINSDETFISELKCKVVELNGKSLHYSSDDS
jgi:hypothetical protein